MILPPTSQTSHHHKVTNITMSPTSLSPTPLFCTNDIDSPGGFLVDLIRCLVSGDGMVIEKLIAIHVVPLVILREFPKKKRDCLFDQQDHLSFVNCWILNSLEIDIGWFQTLFRWILKSLDFEIFIIRFAIKIHRNKFIGIKFETNHCDHKMWFK